MKKAKKLLTKQEHRQMIMELKNIRSAKMARKFHKKYRAYGYGLELSQRYPLLPLYLSLAAIVINLLGILIRA